MKKKTKPITHPLHHHLSLSLSLSLSPSLSMGLFGEATQFNKLGTPITKNTLSIFYGSYGYYNIIHTLSLSLNSMIIYIHIHYTIIMGPY